MAVEHLLCTVHSDRTLRRKVKDSEIIKHIHAALWFRRTKTGCEDSIMAALKRAEELERKKNPNYVTPWEKEAKRVDFIDSLKQKYVSGAKQSSNTQGKKGNLKRKASQGAGLALEFKKKKPVRTTQPNQASQASSVIRSQDKEKDFDLVKYLWNEWWLTRALWAHYPREALTILLQITTTNAVESWHNSLKKRSIASRQAAALFSLEGCLRTVQEVGNQWDATRERREHDEATKQLVICQIYPDLAKLAFPLQKLVFKQFELAEIRVQNQEPLRPHVDRIVCDCKWYRQYFLPCEHTWHRELLYSHITKEYWEEIVFRFEERGFETYETWVKDFVQPLPSPRRKAIVNTIR
jgi:hypothetical protein